MLACLRVKNFAIIDALEVEFGPGLNVVTGETGAGKSIMVDALGLVLGDKAKNDLVRTGTTQAEVEALFELADDAEFKSRLLAAGVDDDESEPTRELVVRRIVSAQGRSRAYVNGRLVTQAQLAIITEGLADVSSQHEHHTLVDPKSHLAYLDDYASLDADVTAMSESHRALSDASKALEEARGQLKGRAERADFLSFQLSEIDAVSPKAGESEALGVERERLRHADKLLRSARDSEEILYAKDASITEELAKVSRTLSDAAQLDVRLRSVLELVEQAESSLSDAARELGAYARGVQLDPERLGEVEERLHALQRLARKYAVGSKTPEETVVAHRTQIASELEALRTTEHRIEALERERANAGTRAVKLAAALTKKRQAAAKELSRAVTGELRSLGMSTAEIHVQVRPLETGGELVEGARISTSGGDAVELMIAPNAGEDPKPLRRIASGGELSRTLLGIKRVLAEARREGGHEARSLYVFDEVDTGVGGAVAETIGTKLRDVAKHNQVLCITHLAPIAVYAEVHFIVKKEVVDGRTRSTIETLDAGQRVEEVARMLGGLHITKKTRDAAAELLRGAAN